MIESSKWAGVAEAAVNVAVVVVFGIFASCCCLSYTSNDCVQACAPNRVRACAWHRVECAP